MKPKFATAKQLKAFTEKEGVVLLVISNIRDHEFVVNNKLRKLYDTGFCEYDVIGSGCYDGDQTWRKEHEAWDWSKSCFLHEDLHSWAVADFLKDICCSSGAYLSDTIKQMLQYDAHIQGVTEIWGGKDFKTRLFPTYKKFK